MNPITVVAGIAAAAALTLTTPAASAATGDPLPSQRACAQEDSTDCVWDAIHMGNGQGKSFWAKPTQDERVYYSHAIVHRLRYGHWEFVPDRLVGERVDLVHGGTKYVTPGARWDVGDTTLIVWPDSPNRPVGTS